MKSPKFQNILEIQMKKKIIYTIEREVLDMIRVAKTRFMRTTERAKYVSITMKIWFIG
jgi:hypothetical protein